MSICDSKAYVRLFVANSNGWSIRIVKSNCTWPWFGPLVGSKVKSKYAYRKALRDFLIVGNRQMFAKSVAVFEIITYEHPNVLDSNLWPVIMMVKNDDDLDVNWQASVSCQHSWLPKLAPLVPSVYFRWHFVTYEHSQIRTYIHNNIVQLRLSGAEIGMQVRWSLTW